MVRFLSRGLPAALLAGLLVAVGACSKPAGQQVATSPDNPYAVTSETWTVTYEGILPGFAGTAGSFIALPG